MKTKLNKTVRALMLGACLTFSLFTMAQKTMADDLVYVTPEVISLDLPGEFEAFKLTVSGPNDLVFTQAFDGRNVPFIEMYDPQGNLLPDGSYTFELVGMPRIDTDVRAAMDMARQTGDRVELKRLMNEAGLNAEKNRISGYFSVNQGFAVMPENEAPAFMAITEEGRGDYTLPGNPTGGSEAGGTTDVGSDDRDVQTEDQVIADDLIVTGSICVGFDCVNGESFGFDTIRLKENNLRIKFDDTSTAGSFPNVDWQLTANDSANGGANKFSIDDITNSRTPFTVEASAPSHSLYVDDGGRVGFGTSTPVVDLHVKDGDSPTLRLEQDTSSGFAAQTWDLAGNETNLFFRDATNGSQLPFRIRPGADSNRIYLESDNNVAIGNTAADAMLHVGDASGDTQVLVKDTNGTNARRDLLFLQNNGEVSFTMAKRDAGDASSQDDWNFLVRDSSDVNVDTEVLISRKGNGVNEIIIRDTGDVIIGGTLTQGSDRNRKTNINEVDPQHVLDRVVELPISTWSYIGNESTVHMGPMAQDFRAMFGLGDTDLGISAIDSDGVALAAIKGLNQRLNEKEAELAEKDATIQDLNDRLSKLEALVERLADEQ